LTCSVDRVRGGGVSAEATRHLIDAKEVARRLDCSSRHVLRMADAGLMPWGIKLGALRRWDSLEIEDFIAGGCKPPRKGGR
jgi:predicted DNA-binding transcriptional regulator AlpA